MPDGHPLFFLLHGRRGRAAPSTHRLRLLPMLAESLLLLFDRAAIPFPTEGHPQASTKRMAHAILPRI